MRATRERISSVAQPSKSGTGCARKCRCCAPFVRVVTRDAQRGILPRVAPMAVFQKRCEYVQVANQIVRTRTVVEMAVTAEGPLFVSCDPQKAQSDTVVSASKKWQIHSSASQKKAVDSSGKLIRRRLRSEETHGSGASCDCLVGHSHQPKERRPAASQKNGDVERAIQSRVGQGSECCCLFVCLFCQRNRCTAALLTPRDD